MKILNKINIGILSFVALTFLVIACDNKEDYPELVLDKSTAPTVTATHVADSLAETYTYVNLSSNMDGSIYYVAIPEGADVPTSIDIILGKTSPAAKGFAVTANTTYLVKVKGLESAGKYNFYAVSTNSDEGKYGAVFGPIVIQCHDNTAPVVTSMSPENGSLAIITDLSEIVLTFSEAVNLADASKISIINAFDESVLNVMGEVTVSGTNLIIPITETFDTYIDIAVKIEEGAVVDLSGIKNPEYYINAAGDAFALSFSVDWIDMSVFKGAYHCVANEIGFGYGISEFDVIVKGGSDPDTDDYFIQIQNIENLSGTMVYLTVDPKVDTVYFEDQDFVYGPYNLLITSLDEYGIASAKFKPGSLKRDGSEFKVFAEIYIYELEGYYGLSEYTFTKIEMSEAKINTDFNPINRQTFKFSK